MPIGNKTNLKLVLKSNGHIKPRTNYFLLYFLNNLNKKGMVKKVDEDEFYMPKDIQKYFKSHLKDKESLKIIKSNTKEYNLIILLFVDEINISNISLFIVMKYL